MLGKQPGNVRRPRPKRITGDIRRCIFNPFVSPTAGDFLQFIEEGLARMIVAQHVDQFLELGGIRRRLLGNGNDNLLSKRGYRLCDKRATRSNKTRVREKIIGYASQRVGGNKGRGNSSSPFALDCY
ncbi:hypothetical protein [Ensifer sp. SSB1]|uniref:hypothetical protein n=1 Tax=Ensifer sp. SSB1 TaxID=2795385 RepID=UPI001A4B4828|nr:hypothetical protein [Ensifer sp. SSB1]MBK5570929.1 hypothetical protein [Ensifer sp. SSB1]